MQNASSLEVSVTSLTCPFTVEQCKERTLLNTDVSQPNTRVVKSAEQIETKLLTGVTNFISVF